MKIFIITTVVILCHQAVCQQRGTVSAETHPLLSTQKCTVAGGCVVQNTRIVLDANWRWLHGPLSGGSYPNCLTSSWNSALCPDPVTCAQNCYLEGASYASTYGITTNGNNLTLLLYPSGSSSEGSRVYLMSDDNHYQTFNLANQEVTFDVDVSGLPCGANGAFYFTNIAADGGQSLFPNNKAGAYMGTGYCDAQCRQDLHFINGEANLLNWNGATGRYGSCCHEVDVWEANAAPTSMSAHTCSTLGQYRCDTQASGCTKAGVCDQDGCDFNPYRMGNTTFYGSGKTVNTLPGRMRVITQFKTSDNTATGNLTQIVRTYIQGGKVIQNSVSNVNGVSGSTITDAYCTAEKNVFGEINYFKNNGGMQSLKTAMNLGMVLTMSIWLDHSTDMLWLDSTFPNGSSITTPGDARGPCPSNSGNPATMRSMYPNAQVTFGNIKWGDIGTTFGPPYP